MSRTACTEPQCLYMSEFYHFFSCTISQQKLSRLIPQVLFSHLFIHFIIIIIIITIINCNWVVTQWQSLH